MGMTNMERYPNTKDALHAWMKSNSRLVFSYWLDAPCDKTAPWNHEKESPYDMDGWETGEWSEPEDNEGTEDEQ